MVRYFYKIKAEEKNMSNSRKDHESQIQEIRDEVKNVISLLVDIQDLLEEDLIRQASYMLGKVTEKMDTLLDILPSGEEEHFYPEYPKE